MNERGMKCAKPHQHDHRRPDDAEERLKTPSDDGIVGFLGETSPQANANTVRLWSFRRPEMWKNTAKLKTNTFSFYALNGRSVIDPPEHSKKEDVCLFLKRIRNMRSYGRIVAVLGNFKSHTADDTLATAQRLNIHPVFIPLYSPDLNPIECIRKSVERVVSVTFVTDLEHMRETIATEFRELSRKLPFARYWIKGFMSR